jgi:hypothetical protein
MQAFSIRISASLLKMEAITLQTQPFPHAFSASLLKTPAI